MVNEYNVHKQLRTQRKLTQQQAADLCGITVSAWYRREAGNKAVSAATYKVFDLYDLQHGKKPQTKGKKAA